MGHEEVTTAPPAAMRDVLARLAILRNPPDEDVLVEWERQLTHVPLDVLDAAVTLALKTRVFFPLPAELLANADSAAFYLRAPEMTQRPVTVDRDIERALPKPVDIDVQVPGGERITLHIVREWRYVCERCSDSGWSAYWCGPRGTDDPTRLFNAPHLPCDRPNEHRPHNYVRECECIDTNTAITRRKDRQRARYAQEKNTV